MNTNTLKILVGITSLFVATLGSAVAKEYVTSIDNVIRPVDKFAFTSGDDWVESTCVSGDGQVTKVCDDICLASETNATCLTTVPPSSSDE